MGFDATALTQATNFFNNFNNAQKHEILTVSTLQEVKDFVMNRGDSYLLLNPNDDLLYVKEKDNIGKDCIRVFSLTEVTDQYLNTVSPVSISKTDYEKLMKRLERLEQREARNDPKESEQPELDFTDTKIRK